MTDTIYHRLWSARVLALTGGDEAERAFAAANAFAKGGLKVIEMVMSSPVC